MKQILQDFRSGELLVQDVPAPVSRPGCVVVQNHFSVISSGTEGGTVRLGEMSLLQKARARPEQVAKVLKVVRNDGLLAAYQAVTRSLDIPIPLGYCSAGEVLEVGEGVADLQKGARVACAGAGWANHAEVVCVPRNLVVEVPETVPLRLAAFSTLGSIALQSVRVADVRLGERVVVIGLGLVGLLIAQVVRAAGCRVFGIDVDAARVAFANEQGYCQAASRSAPNLQEQVLAWSAALGADAVIVAAPAADNDPVRLAGELCRHKARVVVVGRTSMEAPRETYLFKELELRTSLAYGPGTGDPSYEVAGHDYPVGYVRWTENRNMSAFVDLVAAGSVRLEPMVTHEFPVEQAPRAFATVTGKTAEASLAVLLRYPPPDGRPPQRSIVLVRDDVASRSDPEAFGVGVIGAGSFATTTLVPLLRRTRGVALRGIVSSSGTKARALADRYGFVRCGSDPADELADSRNAGILVLSRHDSHSRLTLAALEAGKHVFVEKPMALNAEDVRAVVQASRRAQRLVQVGFNRRFAPLTRELVAFFEGRAQPMTICYRANVGHRPPDHWLHDPEQGGGVLLGEAVHFVDFCQFLVGAPPVRVSAFAVDGQDTGLVNQDNAHVTFAFADGSIASVIYVSNGDPAAGRERVEVQAEGGFAVLEDFRRLTTFRRGRRRRWRRLQDRGHAAQLAAMVDSWRTGSPAVPVSEAAVSTLATLEAVAALVHREARPIDVASLGDLGEV